MTGQPLHPGTMEVPHEDKVVVGVSRADPASDRRPAIAAVRHHGALRDVAALLAASPGGRYLAERWTNEPLHWAVIDLADEHYTLQSIVTAYGYQPYKGRVHALLVPVTVADTASWYARTSEVGLYPLADAFAARSQILTANAIATILCRSLPPEALDNGLVDGDGLADLLGEVTTAVLEVDGRELDTVAVLLDELTADTLEALAVPGNARDILATLRQLAN